MEFEFTKAHVTAMSDGSHQVTITVEGQRNAINEFHDAMRDNTKAFVAKMTRKRGKRSLDANAYLWILCQRIADKTMQSREDVYREMIIRNGEYTDICINDEKASGVYKSWRGNGTGWFTEYIRESKEHEGWSWHRFYHGSSVYDTKQMSRIIDAAVMEAGDLGIETMTPDEVGRIKGLWKG